MSSAGDVSSADRREQLEQRAEATRARLGQRLEALDERRDRLGNVMRAVSEPPLSFVLIGGAGLLATGLIVRALTRRRPTFADRLRSVIELSQPARSEGFWSSTLKRSALSLLTTAAQRYGAQALDRVLAESSASPPREAVPVIPRSR
jgi:hypothetical protein